MKYKFEDIAINITAKKKPTADDIQNYIGLEHMDSNSIYITRYGSKVPLKGEKLIMVKGDILFGKRNTYLKRVAIAPHDGLFSAHGMILRPKEKVIDKDFFPFFVYSDYFLDSAIRISIGSLSPTINWSQLKELEFNLPHIQEQQRLGKLLWAFEDTKQAYKKLIAETDSLVKAKFIEMFGDPETNPMGWEVKCLGKTTEVIAGQSPEGIYYNHNYNGLPFYQGKTEFTERFIGNANTWTTKVTKRAKLNDIVMSVRAPVGPVNIIQNDCCIGRGLCAIRVNNGLNHIFLFFFLKFIEDKISQNAGTVFPSINKSDIESLPTPLPPLQFQEEFANFIHILDIFRSNQVETLTSLDTSMRALLRSVYV